MRGAFLVTVILVMALSALAPGLARAAEPELPPLPQGEIRIATYSHYPPWTITADGVLSGFEIDLVEDVCRRIQRSCQVIPANWDTIIDDLVAGRYDAYIGAMSITEERRRRIDFSVAYAFTPEFFATRCDSSLAKLITMDRINFMHLGEEERDSLAVLRAALAQRVVGVHYGTVYERFMKEYLAEIGSLRIYHSELEKYRDLSEGRLDAILDGGAALTSLITESDRASHRVCLFGPALMGGILGQGFGIAVPKTQPGLRQAFDSALNGAKSDGTIARISLKWFGYNVGTD